MLLTAGKVKVAFVDPGQEADFVKCGFHGNFCGRVAFPVRVAPEAHHLSNREGKGKRRGLGKAGPTGCQFDAVVVGKSFAIKRDGACVEYGFPGKRAEQGALAGAVGTDNYVERTGQQ